MNGPESHSPPSAPSLAIPRFDIEEEAARQGGIGTIHRGRDRETGQAVAIKVLRQASPAEVTRFRREAELLSKLSHPAIVRHVAHAFLPTGEPYLVMEWLSGESLADRLARGPLSPGETLAVAKRVASALAFAHSRGLVHRDIKPGNIFLVDRQVESATLIDFGVAHSEFISAEITDVGTMVGTLGYMAPEQARGDREVDARADFFSLGCVIFKCLTGRTPFVGDNLTSILAKTLFEDAPRLRDLTPEVAPLLDALVARLLSKNPLARPASATALVEDLERIPLDEDLSGGPYPSGSRRGITAGEQHLVSVVLATAPNVGALDDTLGAAPTSDDGSTLAELHAIAAKFGATMAPLANGLVVATLSGTASAMDQAAAAARCALAMAQSLGSAQVVLATGRGMLGSGLPVGVAIDRAVHLLGVRRPSSPTNPLENASVLVDDVTAGLLDAQFVMMEEQLGAFRIVRERSVQEVGRTLLGRPTPFVGRNRELGVLCTVFDACVDEGRAQCVLVTGDPGVGKSRLRYEFLRGLRTKHIPMEIWSARGEPMAAGAPLRLLSHALRSALGLVDSESLEASRERIRLRVAKHVPPSQSARVSEFMGEWVGVPFPDEDSVQLRAARRNAILRGDQMRRAFFDFIEAESAAQPVLLVLEDMQWGDEATCELIDAALQRLKNRPFLVLSLGRPEMLDRFPRLWEKRSPLRVDVSELSPQASEKLAREVLKDRVTPTTIRRLVERADGNAFFLEELIRAVAFETVEVALPETVVAVVQARLASRNAEERRILRAASVFGDTFPVGGVAAILGEELSATSVRARLDQLALDELVYRRPISRLNGEVEYAFRHARVREAAYATLTESDRSLAHHLAGQWLSLAGERDAFALAEHFERAGAYSNATEWYRRAAEQALEADKLDLAIDRAERGVRGASGETLGMLRLLQSEAHTWRGEYAEALARGDEAMQWLPKGGEMWAEAAGQVAEACGRLGLYDKLSQLAVSLDQLSGGEHSGRVLIARVRAATQLMYAGRFESAQSLIDAAEASRPYFLAHEPAIVAWIDYALSVRALFAGDLGDNVRLKESVIENFEKAGDHRNACMQRVRLGYGWIVVGSAREGERVLREALMEARRAGLAKASALAKHNLGLALLRLGQHKEAATLENEALVAFAAQGDRRLCAASHLYLAWIWEALGDGEQAEFHAKETIAHQEPNSPMYAEALATLAELRLRSDKAADAFEPALRAHELMLKLGAVEDSEALIRLVYARTLHGAGSVALGKRALAEAKARLLERAQRIRDPELRRGFLEDEPVNRSTMSLASDWLS